MEKENKKVLDEDRINMVYNIAVVINQKYVPHMLVMVKSLFHSNKKKDFCVYILHSGLDKKSKAKIEDCFSAERQTYIYKEADLNELSSAPILDNDLSREAYFKLFIPRLIPENVERILYLDSDIIVVGDIEELYQYDLRGKALGAAADLYMDRDVIYKTSLMTSNYTYFNSGVLLIDMNRFRSIFNLEQAMKYIEKNGHKFRFHDQEVLNALYHKEAQILPDKYNYVTMYKDRWDPLCYRRREKKKGIVILHYAAGNNKPWKPEYAGKYPKHYWRIANQIQGKAEYKKYKRARKRAFPKIAKNLFCTVMPNFKSNIKLAFNVTWLRYWIRYFRMTKCKRFCQIFKIPYSKQQFLSAEKTNEFIRKGLLADKPFMACRIGANESFSMRTFEFQHHKNAKKAVRQLCLCAGFFPDDVNAAGRFVGVMKESLKEANWCGVLKCPFDDYFLNRYVTKHCKVGMLYAIDPVVYDEPWTQALAGKKVLVVHPFTDSIEKQYKKRERLFPGRNVLPEFELLTLKAVQTIAGVRDERFADWFEALDYMLEQVERMEFDIALLACGAYGLPLAAKIKQMGKKVIHVGGGLQILFGIKGKRWDDNPKISCLYNDEWVYPDETETPQGAQVVESGCYWK